MLDERFEIAKKNHEQACAFCMEKTKNKQNYPLNGNFVIFFCILLIIIKYFFKKLIQYKKTFI